MEPTLNTAPLGATGLEITRVGFGAWAIGGGDWEHGSDRPYVFTKCGRLPGPGGKGQQPRGLVRHLGGSNFGGGQLRRAQAIAPVDVLQPPYSLVAPDVGEGLGPAHRADDAQRIASCPTTTGAGATSGSGSPRCRATWTRSSA